jgi:hypothetical protein
MIYAFRGWTFVNDTGQAIALKLNVLFELSGSTANSDSKLKNKIIINQNSITIKVIDSKRIVSIK